MSIGFTIFAQLTIVPNTQTDRLSYMLHGHFYAA